MTIVFSVCGECGVRIYHEDTRLKYLQEHPGTKFYCPNGHCRIFTGDTDAKKIASLQAKVLATEAAVAARDREIERLRNRRTCKECNRTFSGDRGLQTHVSRAHSPRRALPKDAGPDAFGSGRGLVDDTVIPIKRGRK